MASNPQPGVDSLPNEPLRLVAAPPAPEPASGLPAEPRPLLSRWAQPRHVDDSYVELERRALPALTSLRFFAAFYVVVHHLINVALLHSQGADADREATWYLAWATQGHVGVTFFFVLSGFILAWCYHRAFAAAPDDALRSTRRRFLLARFARVWPLHAAMFVVFLPLAVLDAGVNVAGIAQTAWQGALNLSLLHAWVPGGADGLSDTFNAPSWTLSCEALFYVVFPAIATLLVRRLRWGTAQLTLLIAAMWLMLGAAGAAAAGTAHGDWLLRVFPGSRLADFTIGVALGLIVVQHLQKRALRSQAPAPRVSGGWTALEAALITATCLSPLLWTLAASGVLPETLGASWFHLPTIGATILVMALERGAISRRLLAMRSLVWLGEISYALYLVHLFIILAAYRVGLYDLLGPWATSALVVALALGVSAIVHERFEKPARARIVARYTRS